MFTNTFIGKLLGDEEEHVHTQFLEFIPDTPYPEINATEIYPSLNTWNWIGIVFAVFFAPIFLGSIFFGGGNRDSFHFILAGVSIIGLTWAFYKMVILKNVGKITIQFEPLPDGRFKQIIKNRNNWRRIHKVLTSYEVIEEVEDNRGTYSRTLKNTIFLSPVKKVSHPSGDLQVTFDFPKMGKPSTIQLADVRIYWQAEIKAFIFFGIPVTLKSRFSVSK